MQAYGDIIEEKNEAEITFYLLIKMIENIPFLIDISSLFIAHFMQRQRCVVFI